MQKQPSQDLRAIASSWEHNQEELIYIQDTCLASAQRKKPIDKEHELCAIG